MLRKKKSIVASIDDAPHWMVDNFHLKSGYRVNFRLKDLFKSLFMKHNDLLNIWTHLVGVIIFLALVFYLV